MTRLIWLTLTLLAFQNAYAENDVIVRYVYDGDTVQISQNANIFKLRLSDIDAPERNQPYGLKARRALIKLCQGEHVAVNVEITGTDQYARQLGKLHCNGTDASLYLVRNGFAWHAGRYARDPVLKLAAEDARSQQLGLWQDPDPIPPWRWRKRNTEAPPKP